MSVIRAICLTAMLLLIVCLCGLSLWLCLGFALFDAQTTANPSVCLSVVVSSQNTSVVRQSRFTPLAHRLLLRRAARHLQVAAAAVAISMSKAAETALCSCLGRIQCIGLWSYQCISVMCRTLCSRTLSSAELLLRQIRRPALRL